MKQRDRSICKHIKSVFKKVFSARSTVSSQSTNIVRPYQSLAKTRQIQEDIAPPTHTNILTWHSGYRLENGEFTIERELGRGGFGVTYLAKDDQGDRFVIKTIVNDLGQSREQWAEFWENFANEAVKLAICGGRNPHIVKLHKVISERELPCIVMEYIEGKTLAEIVNQEGLNETQALKYITQIGTALTEIHRQGLLHRDVKPLNIMVRNDGSGAVLIDFGIARKFASGVAQTYLPAVTPGYAPIEQYEWRSIQDTYTDVYALAATLYFALTGKTPVTADMRLNGIPLTPPSQINPQISQRVERAIIHGLSLKGKQRPNSIQLLLEELLDESEEIETVIFNERLASSDEYPEGSLAINSPYYIKRPEVDRVFAREIVKPGTVVRIKAARLMGKTSLINRLLVLSSQQLQGRTVQLNLLEADQKLLFNPNWFLRWMCARIAKELKLPHQLKERWDDELYSPTSNCTYYFEEYLLPQINCPLVLSLDEVDRIFPYPQLAPDFFGMLRVWHDKASNNETWRQLRLIIAHSTEVYVKLKLVQSPFNVGVGKELRDFNLAQTIDLASRYRLHWNESQAAKLMQSIGGHPHLLRLAIYHIARGEMTVDTLLSQSLRNESIYGNHLRRFLWSLQQDDKLIDAYRQVVNIDSGVQLNYQEQLWLSRMGLIRINPAGLALPRCQLYRQYFSRVLNSNGRTG